MVPRKGHIIWIVFVILTAGIRLHGQTFTTKYNFKQLNVQNGLTQNIVYHFRQDSRGYVWIGTHNGLNLFDGTRTINFMHNDDDSTTLGGNFISSILEDSSQQIWIGNEMGIDRYNRQAHTFTHFGVDRPDGSKDRTYCVALGFVKANELWFLDTKTRSVRALNTTTGSTNFVAEFNVYHAFLYKNSKSGKVDLWSAYDKGTVHQVYQDGKLILEQTFFNGKNGAIAVDVGHVLQENDTITWISTSKGLAKLNAETGRYTFFNNWNGRTVRELRYAALSRKGQLWLGSGPDGIFVFDTKTHQFIANYRNDKLDPFSVCSDNVVSVYFDKSGQVWCGSYGDGSSYANVENSFFSSHLSKNDMKPWHGYNDIEWLGFDKQERLWCMMSNTQGFWILDKNLKVQQQKNPYVESGSHFDNGFSKLLFDNDGNVWCATNIGLYLYDLQTNIMKKVKYPLMSEEVQGSIWMRDIYQLKDGSIIFSTFVGLYRITKESGNFVIRPLEFLPPGAYTGFGKLFQDENDLIYVKSLSEYLYVLKPGKTPDSFQLIKTIRFAPFINHYFHNVGDSVIYLSTLNGFYRINKKTLQLEKEEADSKIPFRNLSGVVSKNNQLWIFGPKGLYYFDQAKKTGRNYTEEDGLPASEFTTGAVVTGPGNLVVAGSSNGLLSFYPDQRQDTIFPPWPQITNIYVNDILQKSVGNPNEFQKLNLSYKENTFSFDFSPIAYQHASDCSFEFKLDGYDENWLTSGPAHYTRYSKIPPGGYTFQLRAVDAMGRQSPILKTIEIEIAKAFWQTVLFKLGVFFVLVLISLLFSRWYFRQKIRKQKLEFEKQQAIEKERTRIATDMHDDLGAGLSRIRFLSQALTNKSSGDNSVKEGLEKITSYSDEMTEKMGEIVWALNEKNDTLADLVAYTRSYAVEYLANRNISCEADTPLDLPGNFIPGEIRRNIFLSVKECLHNIVKHSEASNVRIAVHFNRSFEIIIHDNGKGIDWNKLRTYGNGLRNIQKRMQDIGGSAEFVNDKGTKIVLHVPFSL